ncbi:MAG: His/Gly/Thr/Pro-type tRNA ligase C-terminal domain-containing protein [Patescibacteria group bacterium]|nr:His/Gly/Thr/Pro-type tRNA ligase C-terminal domain-containing protein [Patescibacteria group bacterium]
MKFTDLFTKTQKDIKDSGSANADLLVRGGYVNQLSAGIYTYLPLGWRVYKKIEEIIREEMSAAGGQEIFMPAMHPKANWEKTGRWENLDVLYKVVGQLSGAEMALGPTHEEIVTPLASRFVLSYKDLPKYVFQIQDKFRDEARPKSGLLRTREFMMKDLYSFHADEKDLDRYYEIMKNAYFKIFTRVGLGEVTVLTYASGGSFSRYSHEFQAICETGEDTIYLCEKCNVAVNKEIIHEQKSCPECGNKDLKEKKSIEIGNIFKLRDKFSKAFDFSYLDEKNQKNFVEMGCYGIGLGRLMASIVEVLHDKSGIVWPNEVAPYKFHLVNLNGAQEEAADLYEKLKAKKVDVIWDDRDERAGIKLSDADLLGIPNRIIVSPKTISEKAIEVKRREESEGKIVLLDKFLKEI